MHSPNQVFDPSNFIRKLSLRKKKWPDDYVITAGDRQGSNSRRSHLSISLSPTSSTLSPFHSLWTAAASPTSPQPLTSHALSELRTQFSDQLKCLDSKLDLDVTVMSELHEFYRRRALVEQEYSDALAKLVNSLKHKHSIETGK